MFGVLGATLLQAFSSTCGLKRDKGGFDASTRHVDFDAAQKTVDSLNAHWPRAVSRRSGCAAASATEAPKVRGGGPATREVPGAGLAGGCRFIWIW